MTFPQANKIREENKKIKINNGEVDGKKIYIYLHLEQTSLINKDRMNIRCNLNLKYMCFNTFIWIQTAMQ